MDDWPETLAAEADSGLPVALDHFKIVELWYSGLASQDQKHELEYEIERAVIKGDLKAVVLLRDPNSEARFKGQNRCFLLFMRIRPLPVL